MTLLLPHPATRTSTTCRNFKFNDVHVKGAKAIAEISEAAGVSRLVHVSHLNADPNSKSAFLRSKAEGEEAVKKAYEGATIVRPGPMYGHEDRLLNQMACKCLRCWASRRRATELLFTFPRT